MLQNDELGKSLFTHWCSNQGVGLIKWLAHVIMTTVVTSIAATHLAAVNTNTMCAVLSVSLRQALEALLSRGAFSIQVRCT